ncbi:MAG: hypothetical protein JNL09_00805 [Anaerolineales bacterium]|nr:hypothetical protein [Anaerolineales bacterium]
MKKESFSEKLEKWGNEPVKLNTSSGCLAIIAQVILFGIIWFGVSYLVRVVADWLGYQISLNMQMGLGGIALFSLLLSIYRVGSAEIKTHFRKSRSLFLITYFFGLSVFRLLLALAPFFASVYPISTCDEIKGAGFSNQPAWTSINSEMMNWVSEEYLLNRNQIELKTNSPLASLNEIHWETLKADYWLAYPTEPYTYYPRYMGIFWKRNSVHLSDIRGCLGEPTDYLITQDPTIGKPQSLYIWYNDEGFIGFGELSKSSVNTIDEVAITKMYFGPKDFLRTSDDLARSLGHTDISTPLPWTSVEAIKLP